MLILSLFHLIYVLSITAIRLYFCCPVFHCLKPCKLIFSAEVNFESAYWRRQMKKSISQIILCSFYLKAKAASYNRAAPGQPPIHRPVIVFPSKKFLCISVIKIFHRVKYSLARFWPRRNFFLASMGLNGPNRLPRGLPRTWPRGPLMLSPWPGCRRAAPARFPSSSWDFLGPPRPPPCLALSLRIRTLGGTHFWQHLAATGPSRWHCRRALLWVRARPGLCRGHPGPLVTPREQLTLQFPDSERRTGLLGCPGRATHRAGPGHEGLLVPARPWHFTEQY